jgi:hypothetical protein
MSEANVIFGCEGPADFTDGKGSLGEFILDRLAVGGDKVALVGYLRYYTAKQLNKKYL